MAREALRARTILREIYGSTGKVDVACKIAIGIIVSDDERRGVRLSVTELAVSGNGSLRHGSCRKRLEDSVHDDITLPFPVRQEVRG